MEGEVGDMKIMTGNKGRGSRRSGGILWKGKCVEINGGELGEVKRYEVGL